MSTTLIRRRPTNTSRRAGGAWMNNPAAAPAPVLTNSLRVSTAVPCSRHQRCEVCRHRHDVLVCYLRHRFLHQLRVDAVSPAILEQVQLACDVDRVQAGEPRHVAQTLQRIAVADAARDGLTRPAGVDERFAFRDAPFRHVEKTMTP